MTQYKWGSSPSLEMAKTLVAEFYATKAECIGFEEREGGWDIYSRDKLITETEIVKKGKRYIFQSKA